MATVQELSALHRRYADVSHRFRAGWTFHQFLQSLGKTLLQRVEDPHSTEFQNLYTGLKEISQSLNASESERLTALVPYSNVTLVSDPLGFTDALSVAPPSVMLVAAALVTIGVCAGHASVVKLSVSPKFAPAELSAPARK